MSILTRPLVANKIHIIIIIIIIIIIMNELSFCRKSKAMWELLKTSVQ